jgi:uncharacterized protein YlxW (UPF0749 family)
MLAGIANFQELAMPSWLPLIKASLPYLTQIVTTAIPVFTSRGSGNPSGKGGQKPDELLSRQIAELQSAVTQNAESVHTLATRLEETLRGVDFAATTLQDQLAGMRRLAGGALAVAVCALIVAAWAVARG